VNDKRPVWFIYSGMGSQWVGMGQEMMVFDNFRESILKCSDALRHLGCDPYSLIMKGDDEVWTNTMNCMVCITAIQVCVQAVCTRMRNADRTHRPAQAAGRRT
jgi:fatty acid synthase